MLLTSTSIHSIRLAISTVDLPKLASLFQVLQELLSIHSILWAVQPSLCSSLLAAWSSTQIARIPITQKLMQQCLRVFQPIQLVLSPKIFSRTQGFLLVSLTVPRVRSGMQFLHSPTQKQNQLLIISSRLPIRIIYFRAVLALSLALFAFKLITLRVRYPSFSWVLRIIGRLFFEFLLHASQVMTMLRFGEISFRSPKMLSIRLSISSRHLIIISNFRARKHVQQPKNSLRQATQQTFHSRKCVVTFPILSYQFHETSSLNELNSSTSRFHLVVLSTILLIQWFSARSTRRIASIIISKHFRKQKPSI